VNQQGLPLQRQQEQHQLVGMEDDDVVLLTLLELLYFTFA
jgi:hypothetical protein